MNEIQVALVKQSFAKVAPIAETASSDRRTGAP